MTSDSSLDGSISGGVAELAGWAGQAGWLAGSRAEWRLGRQGWLIDWASWLWLAGLILQKSINYLADFHGSRNA